jgi:hypothetical protein
MLTINCNTIEIFKTSDVNFKIFDSHSRDSYGIPHPFGKCVSISVEGIDSLIIYLQNTVPRGDDVPFEIKGVTVELANCDIGEETGIAILTGKVANKRLETARNYKQISGQ